MPTLPDSIIAASQATQDMGYEYQQSQQQLQEAHNQATYNPETIASGNANLDAQFKGGYQVMNPNYVSPEIPITSAGPDFAKAYAGSKMTVTNPEYTDISLYGSTGVPGGANSTTPASLAPIQAPVSTAAVAQPLAKYQQPLGLTSQVDVIRKRLLGS